MIVIDNAFDSRIFKKIQLEILSPNFSWMFSDGTSYPEKFSFLSNQDKTLDYIMTHVIVDSGRVKSQVYANIIREFERVIQTNLNLDKIKMIKMRVNCLTNVGKKLVHDSHIDHPFSHHNAILYLDNSDGDTLIYNEKFDVSYIPDYKENEPHDPGRNYLINVLQNKNTVMESIAPKENRLIIFDGLQYHAAVNPSLLKRRVNIIFNFK